MNTEINSIEALPKDFKLEQLRCRYHTGKAIAKTNSRGRKEYDYRNGIMTALGDIREDVWQAAIAVLIERHNEHELFSAMLAWVEKNAVWLKTDSQREFYAMELYSDRIHDNPDWVGYEDFNNNFRKGKDSE